MTTLLHRIGAVLLAPRRLLTDLPESAGRHDGAALFAAYTLALGLPGLSAALADFLALGLLPGLPGLAQALLPLLPWVLTLSVVEWRLGDARAHRAGLCLVPLLTLGVLAHLADQRGLDIPGPGYLPALLGGLASLALAGLARPAIAPRSDLSEKPSDLSPRPASRTALILGLALTALVATATTVDALRVARSFATLAPVASGDPMPDFELPLLDGGTLRRADLRGAPHLLIFWTTWCGVCTAEMPMYAAIAARHAGSLRVIAVNADRDGDIVANIRSYRAAHDLQLPIALDRGLARDLRVRMYPHLVLLDADARISAVFRGRTLERSLESAISGLTSAGG